MATTKKTTAKKVPSAEEKVFTFGNPLNTIKYNPVGSIALLLLIVSIIFYFGGNEYLGEIGAQGIFFAYCLSVMALDTRPNGISFMVVIALSIVIVPILCNVGIIKMTIFSAQVAEVIGISFPIVFTAIFFLTVGIPIMVVATKAANATEKDKI